VAGSFCLVLFDGFVLNHLTVVPVSDLCNRDLLQELEWTSRNQTAKKMIQKLQVSNRQENMHQKNMMNSLAISVSDVHKCLYCFKGHWNPF